MQCSNEHRFSLQTTSCSFCTKSCNLIYGKVKKLAFLSIPFHSFEVMLAFYHDKLCREKGVCEGSLDLRDMEYWSNAKTETASQNFYFRYRFIFEVFHFLVVVWIPKGCQIKQDLYYPLRIELYCLFRSVIIARCAQYMTFYWLCLARV